MKKEKNTSIFKKIVKTHRGIITEISENTGLSFVTIRKIFNTGKGKAENKEKILNFLENKNLIEKGKYTITEFFEV